MDLLEYRHPPDPQTQRDRSWISADTWRLIDCHAAFRRTHLFSLKSIQTVQVDPEQGKYHAQVMRDLGRAIRRCLRRDRRCQMDKVSREIESLLVSGDIKGAYHCIHAWYKDHGGPSLRPTVYDLDQITTEYQALFRVRPLLGDPLPIHVQPAEICDNPPDEAEILTALKRMHHGKVPGPSGICLEDVLCWHDEVPEAWSIVVSLIQQAFAEGAVPYAFWLGIFVLLCKDEPGKFHGIALLEVLYKLCATVIHLRLSHGLHLHQAIHGFRPNQGTSTAIAYAILHTTVDTSFPGLSQSD